METQIRTKNNKLRLVGFACLFLLMAGIVLFFVKSHFGRSWWLFSASTQPGAQANGFDTPRQVKALGRLEPAGGVIDIGVPLGDRLDSVLVKEGEAVTQGKVLAQLESHREREAAVALAEAQYQEALARKAALEASFENEIKEADMNAALAQAMEKPDLDTQRKKVEFLQRTRDNAAKNLVHLQKARDNGGATEAEVEQQDLALKKTEAELAAAVALQEQTEKSYQLHSAQLHLEALKAKGRAELQIPIKSLETALDLARHQLSTSMLDAPTGGIILQILAHPGEIVGAGQPVLRMADTRHMVAIAEVYETDILRVREGQQATLSSRAFEGMLSPSELDELKRKGEEFKLTGTVKSIGKVIARNRVTSIDPTADADRRVLEVKIALNDKDSELAARLIHLQVTVTIQVENGS